MLTVKSFPRFTLVVCSLILSALPTYALSVPTQYAAANELYNCKPGSLSQTRHFSDPNAASERRWFDILPRFANAFRSNKPIREATVELDDATWEMYQNLTMASPFSEKFRSPQCCQPTWECWNLMSGQDAPTWEEQGSEKAQQMRCCMIQYHYSCPNPQRGRSQQWSEPPACSNPNIKKVRTDEQVTDLQQDHHENAERSCWPHCPSSKRSEDQTDEYIADLHYAHQKNAERSCWPRC